jgi:hypothetical protein
MLRSVRSEFPDVSIRFSGAEEAAIALIGCEDIPPPKLAANLIDNILVVDVVEGEIFGPQPFLAVKTREGRYLHDNFDVIQPQKKWSYVFDDQTIKIGNVESIGVGTAGRFGRSCVVKIIPA